MKKLLINLITSFLGSITACICMAMIVFSLQNQEKKLISKMETTLLEVSNDRKKWIELKSISKKIEHSMQFDSLPGTGAQNNIILQCAEKNELFSVDIKTLSPENIYTDRKMRLDKIQVRMTFFLKKEDSFRNFLKNMREFFPDAMTMQLLSIERVFFNPKEGLLLKGRFHFECYLILFSSEDR